MSVVQTVETAIKRAGETLIGFFHEAANLKFLVNMQTGAVEVWRDATHLGTLAQRDWKEMVAAIEQGFSVVRTDVVDAVTGHEVVGSSVVATSPAPIPPATVSTTMQSTVVEPTSAAANAREAILAKAAS